MPLTDRSKAKPSGFAQVRAAMNKFEGDVVAAEFGQWGGKLIDDDGKPVPPREFLEISCVNVEVLEVTEELSMAIDEWNFRVNCSEFEGSFWVEKFLESADRFKVQIPDELIGKRVVWEKVTLEAKDAKYNSTNFVIAGIKEIQAAKTAPAIVARAVPEEAPAAIAETPDVGSSDPMEIAAGIAVGKTEAQFRSAIATNPQFVNSPLLSMAKAGAITQALVNEGRLIVVKDGTKDVYQKPG